MTASALPVSETFDGFGGARLALHRVGKGAPVILLHGLFSDAAMNWVKFGHAQRIAARGYEVLMPDLRCHGDSAAPHDFAAYPDDVLVRDLEALVAHLDLSQYDLGGFSLGARTCVRAVAGGLAPRRLVLGGMGLEGLTGWAERARFFIDVIDRFDSIERGDPAYFSMQFLKSQGVDRIAARLLLNTMTDTDPAELDRFAMPTLVVCGDEDRDNGSPTALAAAIPDATHVEVPGTHMGSVTKPDLGRAIAEWLGPA